MAASTRKAEKRKSQVLAGPPRPRLDHRFRDQVVVGAPEFEPTRGDLRAVFYICAVGAQMGRQNSTRLAQGIGSGFCNFAATFAQAFGAGTLFWVYAGGSCRFTCVLGKGSGAGTRQRDDTLTMQYTP
jgi:hypothetical protein